MRHDDEKTLLILRCYDTRTYAISYAITPLRLRSQPLHYASLMRHYAITRAPHDGATLAAAAGYDTLILPLILR